MQNFVQPGHQITVAAPTGGVNSGDPVKIGLLFGVAAKDASEGDPVVIGCDGVYNIAKVSAETFAVGDPVFFDETSGVCTSDDDSGANGLVGICVQAAANPSATVRVKIGNITNLSIVNM